MRSRVCLAVLATLLPLAACGGGGGDESAAGKIGVELSTPAGWVASDDGLTVARRSADLLSDVPAAPRVRVVRSTANADINDMVGDGQAADTTVVDEPERIKVAGRDALAITLRESSAEAEIVRRYLAAISPTDASVLFILEAPADMFEASRAQLTRIPGWS